jgi:hypothetical protein
MDITPTEIEISDSVGLLARVEMFDEFCASVEVKTVVSVESWPELSAAIAESLRMMLD